MRGIGRTLIACLVVGSLAAPAFGEGSDREVTKEYTMAHGMVIFDSTHASWSLGTAWSTFRPKAGERFVSFSISDDAGQSVLGHVHIDANGDGEQEHIDFCSETAEPIKLGATKKIEVAVFMGTCSDGTPSLVTEGVITASFSR